MADIQLRLGKDVLVVQGPMDIEFRRRGFDARDSFEILNLTEPEEVEDLHRRYLEAGADCGVTNTFAATEHRLEEFGLAEHARKINEEGVRLVRSVGFTHVLGCMGPCGIGAGPNAGREDPDGESQTQAAFDAEEPPVLHGDGYEAAVEQYARQAAVLAGAGIEAFLLRGFDAVEDALAAMEGIRQECDMPVLACMKFCRDAVDGAIGPRTAAKLLERAGAVAIGCDCMPIDAAAAAVAHMAAACSVPLIALPSAGEPDEIDGFVAQPPDPDMFVRGSLDLLRAGARVIGSSCGSSPACTSAIYATVGGVVFPD